ncbi:MAG: hypothetical protein WA883_11165 [Phormidesmis sp.]
MTEYRVVKCASRRSDTPSAVGGATYSLRHDHPPKYKPPQALLADYAAAQPALSTLTQNDGDLETSLGELIAAAAGTAVYGLDRDRLKTAFLKNLRREICGDDSLREKVETYNKNPTKAALLTELIVYVIDIVTIPINPAIATIAVLWVLKLGLRTFCDYTDPAAEITADPATDPTTEPK